MNNSSDHPLKNKLPSFELQPAENILYQTSGHLPAYTIVWKVFSGLITIAFLIVVSWFVLPGPVNGLLLKILPTAAASVVTQILCMGLVPLLVVAWVIQDTACTLIGKVVLTDKRLWVRGSPYAWKVTETLLDDVDSLTYRRDAIFIRLKSSRKILVHVLVDGKLLAKAYKDYLGKFK